MIATLGDLRRNGYRLHGLCSPCGKTAYLGLDALIARLGVDLSYLKGGFTVRCACGAMADYPAIS